MVPTTASLLLQNGHIIDPKNGTDRHGDLLIEAGYVARIDRRIEPAAGAEVIDVSGRLVLPGLIDVHVHLRDPGFPEKETVQSGCEAAAAGGFTAVACMPNTQPPTDTADTVREILDKAQTAKARVYPIAAATRKMAGEELTDTASLLEAGAVGFSDDGLPIEKEDLMRELLRRSESEGFPVCTHSEAPELTRGGHMNEGGASRRLGVRGMPGEGETAMVERDIDLVREVGGRLHVLHVSVRAVVDAIRKAKAEGLVVTCEASPHHFTLTDEDVAVLGTGAKMSPPLRSQDDREALLDGLADGTIDMIATDHAPHAAHEKLRAFADAPNGVIGLETAVGLVFTQLVEPGLLSVPDAVAKLATVPASVFGVEGGALSPGVRADVTVIDPSEAWTVDAGTLRSLSRNTPFHGRTLRGRPVLTILGGEITHRA